MGKLIRWIVYLVVAIVLGAMAGALTWVFFFLMNTGIEFLWVRLPEAIGAWWWPLPVCLVGGVVIGAFAKRFGDYPQTMNEVMAEVKATNRYEYTHLGSSFVGALLPLLFGGSIGPEAGLTGVIAGLCTWVGDRLRFLGKEFRDWAEVGTAAVVSAVFSAPLFGLAVPWAGSADGEEEAFRLDVPKAKKVAVYLCSIVGALGAMIGLGQLFGGGGGLPRFDQLVLGRQELELLVPLALVCGVTGLLYHASGRVIGALASAMGNRPVVKAVLGGAVLGLAGVALPFSMFAGETQSEVLMETWATLGATTLLLTGVVKVLVTQTCLSMGWRGGHFFPLIFAGISMGYGFAALTGANPEFCLCVCTAALMGAVMRQPLMCVLLLCLCFPARSIVVMLAAAAIGSILPLPKSWLAKASREDGASTDAAVDPASADEAPAKK
ncbi:chloride channel protein [Eggerthellaceae bacterium zg-887]|uniref:chloride channel protein n=1 Tax=Xiamenia xianingshaonis TaxID=2682776 RepID=UPI00140BC88D|nr:chloride channel protein [Xiamenia xianingshaonis]NHM15945.1 chloride channel protein [Xiamenia xianingshaonis]